MKSWAWAAVGLLVGAGMMGGAACGKSNNGTGGGGTGGNGGSANNSTTTTVNPTQGTGGGMDCGSLPGQFTMMGCGTCVSAKCCAEAKACDTGTDCDNLLNCEEGGQMTPAQCEATYTDGEKPLTALNSCITKNCGTASTCGVMCTGNTIAYKDTSLAACNSCINGMCCSQFSTLSMDITNSTDPNCMANGDMTMCPPLADLSTCEMTPTAAVCSTDTDAAAAANCENTMCGDTCPQFICDSGIEQTGMGAGTCAACLTTNCCDEFSASMCSDTSQMAACMTWLADFNMCSMDSGACNGDTSAATAYTCQQTNCMTQCAGM